MTNGEDGEFIILKLCVFIQIVGMVVGLVTDYSMKEWEGVFIVIWIVGNVQVLVSINVVVAGEIYRKLVENVSKQDVLQVNTGMEQVVLYVILHVEHAMDL